MSNTAFSIVVASRNPVKVGATIRGFERMFPESKLDPQMVSVPSGVSDQPIGDKETLLGATQRAQNAQIESSEADCWVGIEGGIEESDRGMLAFAWVVVIADGQIGRGRTGGFFLPDRVAELVRQGKELGEADDIVFGRENSKQNEGAIGLLTKGAMDRQELYEHAVVLALVSLKNPGLYPSRTPD
jgi:inosine/xanthosine triphosphatase